MKVINLSETILKTPCFFPSISSIKTNLKPEDYLKLLVSLNHPQFLISSFDIFYSPVEVQNEIFDLLNKAKNQGQIILLDSGNYESYWNKANQWAEEFFLNITSKLTIDISFSFDEQNPPNSIKDIVELVENHIFQQEKVLSNSFTVPIIHAPINILTNVVIEIANKLEPIMIAIPERILGDGILERAKNLTKIRNRLNELNNYYPIHLLGTGNPLSILVYIYCGADSFDGLEWCQTTVNYNTGLLYHFSQRELFDFQIDLAKNSSLPYVLKTLAHNLCYYEKWMHEIQVNLDNNNIEDMLKKYLPGHFLEKIQELQKDGMHEYKL